jgi:hypothetical protein
MTKTIILAGGPDDGRTETIDCALTSFKVVHPKPINLQQVVLNMRIGVYQQTGEYDWTREIFTWTGWQEES